MLRLITNSANGLLIFIQKQGEKYENKVVVPFRIQRSSKWIALSKDAGGVNHCGAPGGLPASLQCFCCPCQ
jgi:hypothetical protein